MDDSDFPMDSREKEAWAVGITEHVGHAMTCKLLMMDTLQFICQSNICSAKDPKAKNPKADVLNCKLPMKHLKDCHDSP